MSLHCSRGVSLFPLVQRYVGQVALPPSAAAKPRVAIGDFQGCWGKTKSLGKFHPRWSRGNHTELEIKHIISSPVSTLNCFCDIGQRVYFYQPSLLSLVKQADSKRHLLGEKNSVNYEL